MGTFITTQPKDVFSGEAAADGSVWVNTDPPIIFHDGSYLIFHDGSNVVFHAPVKPDVSVTVNVPHTVYAGEGDL